MRDMERKRAKPQKQQCEGHAEVREVKGYRGRPGGMEKPRQQEQQCEGHTDVKEVERDKGLHRIWKSKDNKKTGDAEERR